MSAVAPPMTRDQRMAALAKANRIRSARAALKVALRDGDVDAWAVIDEPHHDYLTMHVYDLLCAIPQWGPARSQRFLLTHRVSQAKTLGGLSGRQRDQLVGALRGPR